MLETALAFSAGVVATLAEFDEIARHLPRGTPKLEPGERAAAIAARRRHVQTRFDY